MSGPTSPHGPEDRRRMGVGLVFAGQDMSMRTTRYAGRISGLRWGRIRGGLILTMALAAAGYEQQPVLKASQLVPAELLKGSRFQVDEAVPTDNFLARFTIRSDFGTFEAHGLDVLQIRIAEVGALERLEAASKTETFAKALGSAAMRPVKAVGQIVTNPIETRQGHSGRRRALLRPGEARGGEYVDGRDGFG
jgi:hypothetical protein